MRRHNGTNKRLESKLSKSRALQSLQCVLPPTRSTYVLACRGAFPRLSAVPPGPHRRRKTPRYGTHCKFARSDSATLLAFRLAAKPQGYALGTDNNAGSVPRVQIISMLGKSMGYSVYANGNGSDVTRMGTM